MDASVLENGSSLSPMMQQWSLLKKEAGDALLLFRLGDFYEAFYEDAKLLSAALDVVLTQRQGIPMSGVPAHTLEQYIEKLIEKNYLVAIAEQVESADLGKGLVRREIKEILSPATYLSSKRGQSNTFFASIDYTQNRFGLALLDISTGEFIVNEVTDTKSLIDELVKSKPLEILLSQKFCKNHKPFIDELSRYFSFKLICQIDSKFETSGALQTLFDHFKVLNLDCFGLKGFDAAMTAAGSLIKFLKNDLSKNLSHIEMIKLKNVSDYLVMNHSTLKHLEILKDRDEKKHTLESILSVSLTPMGSRKITHFLSYPLTKVDEINHRLSCVESLLLKKRFAKVRDLLENICDLQRYAKRLEMQIISPKELNTLKRSLILAEEVKSFLRNEQINSFAPYLRTCPSLDHSIKKIEDALLEEAPSKLNQSPLFKNGFNQELTDLYEIKNSSEEFLNRYQVRLRDELGAKTLKVSFTRAFGYYIEVSRRESSLMTEGFERRQTLVNTERYISHELKTFEEKILNCEELIEQKELELFSKLKLELRIESKSFLDTAELIGFIDVIAAFAFIAFERGYIKPTVDHSHLLKIEEGKHPVLDALDYEKTFISNDIHLDDTNKMMMITGPNMAGKSTYIRQVALLVIMAQIGSFVPAKSLHIGYFDKVFSRIGASDDLSAGLSTFMVEMSETAHILHHAGARSLVILDEIGRGTSTYDGIAIANSVAEALISPLKDSPKTLFATHYFELTKIETQFPGVSNFRVAIQENEDQILFLRKIVKGALDKSFGIHVAKLAGIPANVIKKAKQHLKALEKEKQPHDLQLSLFNVATPDFVTELENLDIEQLTPINALMTLSRWKNQLKK
jgi:DNA mismatch repair protein MutS